MNGPVQPRMTSTDETGEFPFAASDYVLHLLAAIAMFRDAALDAGLKPLGLNVGRFRTLSVLVRCGPSTMSELSAFSAVDRTTLTRIADHLVGAELAQRSGAAEDRRRVLLDLTDAGRRLHHKGLAVMAKHNTAITAGASDKDLRTAAQALTTIVRNQTKNEATRASLIRFTREDSPDRPAAPSPDANPFSVDPKQQFPLAPGDHLLRLITAMALIRDSAMDAALKAVGLSMNRYRVLGVLVRFGACRMTDLANLTAMDRTSLTRIADHLVRDDHVERKTTAHDRRQVFLEIRPAGRQAHLTALEVVLNNNRMILADIPDEARRETARTLKTIAANLAPNPAARDSIIDYAPPGGPSNAAA